MDIFHLFPTPIGSDTFDGTISDEVVTKLKGLSRKDNFDNQSSFNTQVLEEEGLEEVKEFINNAVSQYFDQTYLPVEGVTPYVTHSWVTYTKSMQGHHMHCHPNALISGVFYIKANDSLVFEKSDGYQFFEIPARSFNEFNATSVDIPTADNKVLLFPSKLLHAVPPTEFDYERMTIAFNVFVKGNLGSIDNGTQLSL